MKFELCKFMVYKCSRVYYALKDLAIVYHLMPENNFNPIELVE